MQGTQDVRAGPLQVLRGGRTIGGQPGEVQGVLELLLRVLAKKRLHQVDVEADWQNQQVLEGSEDIACQNSELERPGERQNQGQKTDSRVGWGRYSVEPARTGAHLQRAYRRRLQAGLHPGVLEFAGGRNQLVFTIASPSEQQG